MDTVLTFFGLEDQIQLWLGNRSINNISLAFTSVWRYTGFNFLVFLGAIQSVNPEIYEAAEIDGASFFRETISITLPLLKPTILYNMVTLVIGVFQWFAEPYIMTQGGPNNATMFYSLYLYQNAFTYFKMGYASAQAWIMLVVAFAIILILFKFLKFGESNNS